MLLHVHIIDYAVQCLLCAFMCILVYTLRLKEVSLLQCLYSAVLVAVLVVRVSHTFGSRLLHRILVYSMFRVQCVPVLVF